MLILLTNDDGIDSPGLAALERVARQFGEVVVAAPHLHVSGISHAVTTAQSLAVHEVGPGRYSVEGTPADCVRLALLELAPQVDWIWSGVNEGANLGVDIHMSGTAAAAREAALMGRPATAWSQYIRRPEAPCWDTAERLVAQVWTELAKRPLPRRAFWNVNFPHRPPLEPQPPVIYCRPESAALPVAYERVAEGYHYRGRYADRERRAGRDVDICMGGGVSISRLTADVAVCD